MKFSLEWLNHFLETDAEVAQVAAALNAIGFEVEGIEDPAQLLDGFCVAQVLTAAPHPNADKLQVLTVDAGMDGPLQVVCGAPNARAGMKGVLGLSGAVVPSNGMQLKKAELRGVESNGMMCSAPELELGEDHDGIIELAADAPVGTPFAEFYGASPVIDISVNPNRPDCMGVLGIARDLAAAGLGRFKPAEVSQIGGSFPCPVEIRSDDPDGC
ncbi:MAG: phenylalanine--tRNA ligase subunit beta, partial [Sphingomonadaceae bacterium]|nr:phenylalanine--tRNA ligase subunit beta [Sphingomonadaceae bacterium]